jgi:hypothetical protein
MFINMKAKLFTAFFTIITMQLWGQTVDVELAMTNISVEMIPLKISSNSFDIPTESGHQQGVQQYSFNNNKYIVVSGSSAGEAYYYVALITDTGNNIIHYKPIATSPLSHAGGIQMYEHYLFVGVEDDDSKMKSEVHIYDISEPGVSDINPIYVVDRRGIAKEKTAGAIGVTMFDGQLIMAVASWDSKTVDFYWSNMKSFSDPNFALQLVSTWRQTTGSRNGWISRWWYPYQNINLFVGTDNKVYLAGFTKHKDGNFMEVFSCFFVDETVQLEKKYSKQFYCAKGANFRLGSGVFVTDDKNLAILAVSKKPKGTIIVNWFGPKS